MWPTSEGARKVATLHDLGLGYLTLGEATPALSGGEAQRLKLASEMGRGRPMPCSCSTNCYGLHPRDVETLLGVFQRLVEQGATVVVVEHDLDFIANADYVIDMGPQGGKAGGRMWRAACPRKSPQTGKHHRRLFGNLGRNRHDDALAKLWQYAESSSTIPHCAFLRSRHARIVEKNSFAPSQLKQILSSAAPHWRARSINRERIRSDQSGNHIESSAKSLSPR